MSATSDITSNASVQTVLTILSLAAKYGLPTVISAVSAYKSKGTITLAEVKDLEMKFKDPETYFQG